MQRAFQPRRPSRQDVLFGLAVLDPRPDSPYAAELAARGVREGAKGEQSNWSRGTRAERWVRGLLRAEGYWIAPNPASLGAADIIAVRQDATASGPVVRAIQVKMLSTFAPSALNDAVRGLLNLPARGRTRRDALPATAGREAWLVLEGAGQFEIAARCVLDAAGTPSVTGPRAEEVTKSLTTMLAGGHTRSHDTRKRSLRERLGT